MCNAQIPTESFDYADLNDNCKAGKTCVSGSDTGNLVISTADLNADAGSENNQIYSQPIESGVSSVKITNTDYNVILPIEKGREKTNDLTINVEKDSKVDLGLQGGNAPLKIPKESNTDGLSLKLIPTEDGNFETTDVSLKSEQDTINLDKVTIIGNPDNEGSATGINLETDKPVVMNLLDFYLPKSHFTVSDAKSPKVSVKKVKVEQGSNPTLTGVTITESLNMAPYTNIVLDNVQFAEKPFNIFTSEKKKDSFFNFKQKVTQVPGTIKVGKMDDKTPLEEQAPSVDIVKENKDTFPTDICQKWANQVKDGEYSYASCINEKENNIVRAYSGSKPKATKKDGLSGGAIAGIVIACVVVVAAIIALLVYFLVIKKKKETTTSTQGDSSIAI